MCDLLTYYVAGAEVKAKEPLAWRYAEMTGLKEFLQQAIKDGCYKPVFMDGLD